MLNLMPHYVNGTYRDLATIRQLASYDLLFESTSKCEIGADEYPESGQINFQNISSTKWPKRYEYPWAINALDLNKNDLVLEVGCGLSSLKYVVAKKCSRIVAIDIDENVIREAEEQRRFLELQNVVIQHADASDMQARGFNKIVCLSMLNTLPSMEKLIHTILNLTTMLEPGGRLVLSYQVVLRLLSEQNRFILDLEHSNTILSEIFNRIPPPLGSQVASSGDTIFATLCLTLDKPPTS